MMALMNEGNTDYSQTLEQSHNFGKESHLSCIKGKRGGMNGLSG